MQKKGFKIEQKRNLKIVFTRNVCKSAFNQFYFSYLKPIYFLIFFWSFDRILIWKLLLSYLVHMILRRDRSTLAARYSI